MIQRMDLEQWPPVRSLFRHDRATGHAEQSARQRQRQRSIWAATMVAPGVARYSFFLFDQSVMAGGFNEKIFGVNGQIFGPDQSD